MSVTYTSSTGVTVNVGSYSVGVTPGLQLDTAVDYLDKLVGVSLTRTNTAAVDELDKLVGVSRISSSNYTYKLYCRY